MSSKLLSGAVEMLILEIVSHGDSYGYQITQEILSRSEGSLDLKEGSLYPALHRLERRKLLSAYWLDRAHERRRKYYRLTPAGRRACREKRREWERFTAAVSSVLGNGHVAT